MLIKPEYPPNIEAIRAAFPLADGDNVIFAFAPYIYNPNHIQVPQEIVAHERVHIMRQKEDPEGWWRLYMTQAKFRLEEELWAHIAEAEYLIRHNGNNRKARQRFSKHVARRLAAPLYKFGISPGTALVYIKKGMKHVNRKS